VTAFSAQPPVTATPAPVSGLLLVGAAPNPFNPRTEIAFELSVGARVALSVYDAAGRRVRTLVAGEDMGAGRHAVGWDGSGDGERRLPSGSYLSRLEAGSEAVGLSVMLAK
jgi:hypothetical protein